MFPVVKLSDAGAEMSTQKFKYSPKSVGKIVPQITYTTTSITITAVF